MPKKDNPKKKPEKHHQDLLKPLSMSELDMDEALDAFMQVDPKKVDKRLKDEGILKPKKS